MKRFREYGFLTGRLPAGARNRISDVPGVTVGHCTRIEGDRVRTGVTVIDPGAPALFQAPLPAAVAVANGYGKLAGATQIAELGTLETPIGLTNTLAVGAVLQGLVELVLKTAGPIPAAATVNAVVGETNDGQLNDIHHLAIRPGDVMAAWDRRTPDFELGAVGAGTGTHCLGWKGGIGSASRVVRAGGREARVGALLQTNFAGDLTILGVPVGRFLGRPAMPEAAPPSTGGSCMMILATDAPLSARQLGRVARRAALGLARAGSIITQNSGDYAVAFSVSRAGVEGADAGPCLPDTALDPLFLAAVEAVEESIYDSLFMSVTMTGRDGHTVEQLPLDATVELLNRHLTERGHG